MSVSHDLHHGDGGKRQPLNLLLEAGNRPVDVADLAAKPLGGSKRFIRGLAGLVNTTELV
jgi:hypothetical protein